jgi:hypothetical protein
MIYDSLKIDRFIEKAHDRDDSHDFLTKDESDDLYPWKQRQS